MVALRNSPMLLFLVLCFGLPTKVSIEVLHTCIRFTPTEKMGSIGKRKKSIYLVLMRSSDKVFKSASNPRVSMRWQMDIRDSYSLPKFPCAFWNVNILLYRFYYLKIYLSSYHLSSNYLR